MIPPREEGHLSVAACGNIHFSLTNTAFFVHVGEAQCQPVPLLQDIQCGQGIVSPVDL